MLGYYCRRDNRYCYIAAIHYFCSVHPQKETRQQDFANLFRLWNVVVADYDVDVRKYVAFACDRAAAIIGSRNSFPQKLSEQNRITYSVHCPAHGLALGCAYIVKELQRIQDCEGGLIQTCGTF